MCDRQSAKNKTQMTASQEVTGERYADVAVLRGKE